MRAMMAGLLIGCCVAVAEAQAFSVSYDQKITKGRDVISSKVSVKDGLFWMEATVEGQRMVTIRNPEGTYTYIPDQGMVMKLGMLPPSHEPVQGGDDYLGDLRQRGATLVGSETINGYACDLYRYTDPQAGETTVWVWKEKQFPVKLVMETPEGTTVVELSNIRLNDAIAESVFQLPAGVPVMDMGSMMGAQ